MNIVKYITDMFKGTGKENNVFVKPKVNMSVLLGLPNINFPIKTKASTESLNVFRSWIYACISERAYLIASAKSRLINPKGEIDDSHPILGTVRGIGGSFTNFELKTIANLYLDLLGEVFLYVQRGGSSPRVS